MMENKNRNKETSVESLLNMGALRICSVILYKLFSNLQCFVRFSTWNIFFLYT
jgi:hypothetical protein